MDLNVDEVRRIALLARLRLSPAELETFVPQLRQILDYIDQLAEYEGLPEGAQATAALEMDDVAQASMPRETLLSNAPSSLDSFLLVPQVKTTSDE